MLSKVTQNGRLLEIESPLGKDKLILTSFCGTESISQLYCFQLNFFSADTELKADQLISKPISVRINSRQDTPRFFHGLVKRFSAGSYKLREGRNYSLELVPWLWFLTCTKDCYIYQNKTVIEIITDIFKRNNFNDFSLSDVKNAKTPRLYCVQYFETAFDFVTRLMEEEGIFYYFKFEKDKHTLILSDSIATYKDATTDEVTFSTGSRLVGKSITAWHSNYQFSTGVWTKSFYDFEKPSNKIQSTARTGVNLPTIDNYEKYEYGGTKIDDIVKKDSDPKNLIQADDVNYALIEGESNVSLFSAGTCFKFNAAELPSESGNYALLNVKHEAYDSTHQSGDDTGQQYFNTFTCIPSTTPFHPQQTCNKPCILGMQTATVVGPQGEEIFTDKYGRIKVQFHWDREGKNDDKSSCWIRVAQAWAGKQWGSIFIPRVGQEVVVSFLDGDPDQPLVVGSVYNAEQMPPYDLPANNTQSGLKTHSSKQGATSDANELRFEDKKDNELVYFHAQKDFHRMVEHDDKLEIKNDQTITINQNRSIEISEGNETIAVKKGNRTTTVTAGNETLKVKNNYNVTVESGNHALEITQGDQTIKVNAGKCSTEAMQSIELKVGQNSIKIDPSGITIKGVKISISGTIVEIKADASLKLEGAISEVTASGMLKLQGGITMIN